METELGRWLHGDPPGLRRQTAWERVRRWVRDHKAWATAGAMLSLVLLVVAGALAFRSLERYQEALLQEEERRQQDALRNATVLVRDARLKLRDPTPGRRHAATHLRPRRAPATAR